MTRYDAWRLQAPDDWPVSFEDSWLEADEDRWLEMEMQQEGAARAACDCRRPCPMSCRCGCHEQIEEL